MNQEITRIETIFMGNMMTQTMEEDVVINQFAKYVIDMVIML